VRRYPERLTPARLSHCGPQRVGCRAEAIRQEQAACQKGGTKGSKARWDGSQWHFPGPTPSGISHLFLVPDRKNRYSIVADAVSSDIPTVAKVDEPFPKLFGKIINHSAKVWICTEYLHTLPDQPHRPDSQHQRSSGAGSPAAVANPGPPPGRRSLVAFRCRPFVFSSPAL